LKVHACTSEEEIVEDEMDEPEPPHAMKTDKGTDVTPVI
jgi:hypothetical protein